jgi:hypothetical protein
MKANAKDARNAATIGRCWTKRCSEEGCSAFQPQPSVFDHHCTVCFLATTVLSCFPRRRPLMNDESNAAGCRSHRRTLLVCRNATTSSRPENSSSPPPPPLMVFPWGLTRTKLDAASSASTTTGTLELELKTSPPAVGGTSNLSTDKKSIHARAAPSANDSLRCCPAKERTDHNNNMAMPFPAPRHTYFTGRRLFSSSSSPLVHAHARDGLSRPDPPALLHDDVSLSPSHSPSLSLCCCTGRQLAVHKARSHSSIDICGGVLASEMNKKPGKVTSSRRWPAVAARRPTASDCCFGLTKYRKTESYYCYTTATSVFVSCCCPFRDLRVFFYVAIERRLLRPWTSFFERGPKEE